MALGNEARQRILVVEDDAQMRDLLERVLLRLGYEVMTVANGSEALLGVERGRPFDLILADVVMPGLKGVDLQNYLKGHSVRTPVIFMSGYDAEVLAEQGLCTDNENFLPKPFTMDALERKIAVTLGRPSGFD